LGIGDWAQSPIPNPQSPIPNPHIKIKYNKIRKKPNIQNLLMIKIKKLKLYIHKK
jgi:hypothetical protein